MALPTLRIIGFIIGIFLITLAIAMVIPMATLVFFERTSDLPSFLWASLITFIAGLALVIPGRPEHVHLRPRDMYLLTVTSWLVVCIFAALPFLLTQHISYTDSFFESMSGITATGSTVLSGLDTMSPGILIWRSLLHWLGGIGFIGMAVAILPLLRIGGMRLFQTESSDRSEKVMPRSHMVARLIVAAYVGITILGSLAFWWAGMGLFDAINHAMSAISTGGFSTSDESLAHWKQPAVHWVAVVVMIMGSLPFTLYVATLRGNRRALIKDQQVQGLLGLLLVTWLVLGTWHWWTTDLHWLDALRHVAVNVTSVVTTTGFALGDYSIWGNFSLMLFFYLGFVGGCSGSTAGGIKIFRFQVAYILLKANLNQLIHPRAVIKQKYNGHRLDEEIVRSILTFSFFFAITICAIALALSLLGLDWMTALTGAASTVSGVGPGLGKPSARPATSPPCRTPPSGSCPWACCWAGWRSLRCLCCAFRRFGVTDGRFLQPRPVLAGRGIEPTTERPEEVARVGKPQQVGNFQQGHARLRQVLLGQFAASVVKQGLETGALLLQAALQGALGQVQRLRNHLALGLALGQQPAQHLARLVGHAAFGKPRQVLPGKTIMQQRHRLVRRGQRRFHVRPFENQCVIGRVEHQRCMEGLFVGCQVHRLIALHQHLARLQGAPGQPAAQRQRTRQGGFGTLPGGRQVIAVHGKNQRIAFG